MSEQDDRIFLKRFSLVIVGLVVFTVVIIILALAIHRQLGLSDNPARETARQERLQPVADVYAGETGRAAAQAAAEEAAGDGSGEVAFDGSTDGEMIYQRVCAACHDSGAAGAPRLAAEDWGDRLDKDTSELVDSAINGLGAMPPKGGRQDLSDEQVEASVQYMLDAIEG